MALPNWMPPTRTHCQCHTRRQSRLLAARPDRIAEALDHSWPAVSGCALTYGGMSGYSGGGKKMIEDYEAKGNAASHFAPYGLTFNHKHLPEMKLYTGLTQDVLFQPVVGNFAQGMLTSVPLHLSQIEIPV